MLVTMSESPASASVMSSGIRRTAPAVDDAELLAQAKAGSPSAFDKIVTVHQEKITRLVHRLLGWKSDVEDVVQDVFVDALNALRKFDGRSTVLTWLTRLAINRCRTHQRRHWLRRHLPLPLGEGRGEGAENSLTAQETIQQVHAAIQKLNQRDREIIVLRYLEEQTIEHITETLNLSRAAVDVRLTRARHRLEKILKPIIEKQ